MPVGVGRGRAGGAGCGCRLVIAGQEKAAAAEYDSAAGGVCGEPAAVAACDERVDEPFGREVDVYRREIKNTGDQTVSGVTVQVLFRNDEAMPPQMETVPLSLIRTREPYVDTQPVSAAPLKPGDEREFRLIFESIPGNWNMQMPEIHVMRVDTK